MLIEIFTINILVPRYFPLIVCSTNQWNRASATKANTTCKLVVKWGGNGRGVSQASPGVIRCKAIQAVALHLFTKSSSDPAPQHTPNQPQFVEKCSNDPAPEARQILTLPAGSCQLPTQSWALPGGAMPQQSWMEGLKDIAYHREYTKYNLPSRNHLL